MNIDKVRKIISAILIVSLLVFNSPALILAQTAPTPPPAPTAPPSAPTPPPAPTAPPSAPTPPPAPENTNNPTPPPAPTPPPTSTPSENDNSGTNGGGRTGSDRSGQTTPSPTPGNSESTGGETQNGQVGDTDIVTGDTVSDASVSTIGNTNLSGGSGTGGSASVLNSSNGAGSTNNGSASVVTNNNTNQGNGANVVNGIDNASVSGNNTSSFNVGNSSIQTGNAEATGTIINSVNTNVDGVMVAEFNISDDHVGDYILDFGSACISGCGGNNIAVNSENGAFSNNNTDATSVTNDTTFQQNDATVLSDLTLLADSGNNDTNFNTAGDSTISTGNAYASGNILNFVNNNLAGDLVYGVVNIFGDLVGDIILTQDVLNALCGGCAGGVFVGNSNNGDSSTNTANANQVTNNEMTQFNNATIDNNLDLAAITGDNTTSFNTGGDSTISTGNADVDVNVINIANMNLIAGNSWLVIVNEAGKWIGKIFGAPEGSNFAGGEGIEFIVGEDGTVTAMNSGNAAGSNNTANSTSVNNNSIEQVNNANIINNVNITANSGGNDASFNTGGDSTIVTGDALAIANIVNFVNNNIIGNGGLVVTVVNVFGSWLGDFVGPGFSKETELASSNEEAGSTSFESNGSGDDPGVGGYVYNDDSVSGSDSESNESGEDEATLLVAELSTPKAVARFYRLSGEGFNGDLDPRVGDVFASSDHSSVLGMQTNDKKTVNLAWPMLFIGLGIVYFCAGKLRNKYLLKESSTARIHKD